MTKTKKLALCAVLTALALGLSYTERFIPLQLIIPLPGVKLGLANIVTLVALMVLDTKSTYAIVSVRCLLGAIFGGLTGLLFSLTGGLLALTVMWLCKRFSPLSVYGISVLGAAAHSVGQIIAAMALMQSVYVTAYLPYLLFVSVATGLTTGAACAGILKILPREVTK